MYFLKISSLMGIEVLIATEFQQRLRLPFGRHCNGTAEKRVDGCECARFRRPGMQTAGGIVWVKLIPFGARGCILGDLLCVQLYFLCLFDVKEVFILLKIWSAFGFYTDLISTNKMRAVEADGSFLFWNQTRYQTKNALKCNLGVCRCDRRSLI